MNETLRKTLKQLRLSGLLESLEIRLEEALLESSGVKPGPRVSSPGEAADDFAVGDSDLFLFVEGADCFLRLSDMTSSHVVLGCHHQIAKVSVKPLRENQSRYDRISRIRAPIQRLDHLVRRNRWMCAVAGHMEVISLERHPVKSCEDGKAG